MGANDADNRSLPFHLIGDWNNETTPYRKEIVQVPHHRNWLLEVELVVTITEAKITNFIWKNIIYRFGIASVIISDNGK